MKRRHDDGGLKQSHGKSYNCAIPHIYHRREKNPTKIDPFPPFPSFFLNKNKSYEPSLLNVCIFLQ